MSPSSVKFVFESLFRDSETRRLIVCKSILGVNRSCSNLPVLGELGRLPMVIHCLEKQLVFRHRLLNMTEDNIVTRAFNEICHLQREENLSWVYSCCLFLETFGIDSYPNEEKG